MPDVRARSAALAAAASAVLLLAGCGKGTSGQTGSATQSGGPVHKVAPVVAQGAVSVATRNTTRVGGALVAADAAGVARTVYPGLTVATRPLVVVIANERNWPAALAASVFAASPTSAPILYTEGEEIPEVTSQTLHAMDPVGDPALGGAQVIRVGSTTPVPSGYVTKTIPATGPAPTAVALAQAFAGAAGALHQVIVVPSNAPAALLMPAAGLSAESGAPILFATPARLPEPTANLLLSLGHPSIYLIDASGIDGATRHELRRLGNVKTITTGSDERTQRGCRRGRSPWPDTPTACSAGASKNPATGSCSRTPAGRSTRPPPRCCPRPATTARCCCSKARP